MGEKKFLLRAVVVGLFLWGSSYAEEPPALEIGRDIREECRAQVAGIYLDYLSEMDSVAANLKFATQKMGSLHHLKGQIEKKIKETQQIIDKSDYNVSLNEQMISLNARMQLINEQIALNRNQLTTNHRVLKKLTEERDALKISMGNVFMVKKKALEHKNKREGDYSIDVSYKHQCKQFHFLCPLPPQQAKNLKDIFELIYKLRPKEAKLIACKKYSQILPVP